MTKNNGHLGLQIKRVLPPV